MGFPAFFTPKSGLDCACKCEDAAAVARMCHAQYDVLKLPQGIILACPVPAALAAEAEGVEKATAQAIQETIDQNVLGRDVTPFLLKRINEITGGESLKANIALIKNNAAAGAEVASAWHKLRCAAENGSPNKKQKLS